MNNFLRAFYICLIFTTVLSAKNINLTNEELNYINNNKIRVAMLPDFPPFSFIKDNKQQGFSYDILKLISYKSGLKLGYETDKWPNNLDKFKNKKVDIIDSISFRESRTAFTNFTKPYHESPLIIFSRKEITSYTGLESLKNKKIGLTKNIFYKKDIEKLKLFEIIEYNSFEDKLKALAFGEVDIIFGHLHSTQNSIKKKGYTNIKALDELNLKNLKKTDLRFGVTKENKLLFSILNKGLDSINTLEWERLSHTWLNVHSPPSHEKETTALVTLSLKEKEFLKNNDIKCITTGSWGPFNIKENNKITGISIDYWNTILKHIDIKNSCQEVDTFTKVLNQIKNKTADVTISTAITKERLQYANFSKSYISYPLAITTRNSENFISNISYLENKKVAVGKDYTAYEILKYNYPKINLIQVKNINEALKLVSNGEAYAAVDILPVLAHQIAKHEYTNLKITGTTEFDFNMRIMVRDDYPELVSIINKSIDLITREERNLIGQKWVSVKYDKNIDTTLLMYILVIVSIIGLFVVYKQSLLKKYNKKLEQKVEEEVKKNRIKDRQMLHQSRLAQMGEMISMIAHQWRQPLQAISATTLNIQTHIELDKFDLSTQKGKDKFIKFSDTEFNNIDLYIESLSETLEDFRNFYKPNKQAELLMVNTPIKTALTIVKASLNSDNIKLIERYYSTVELNLFKNEFIQVILNLIKNSQDSFAENKTINPTITIQTEDLEDGISIEFKDNGAGIKDTIADNIFSPYFSTKGDEKGTGLGLYMSKIIIEEHHKGKFYIKQNEKGISFIIVLLKA